MKQMITDAYLNFSNGTGQSITNGTTLSDNIIDVGRDIGEGHSLTLIMQAVGVTNGTGTLTVDVLQSNDPAFATADLIASTGALSVQLAVGQARAINIPPQLVDARTTKKYLALRYTVSGGLNASFSSFITLHPSDVKNYSAGWTVK